jgi:hypothetical protein
VLSSCVDAVAHQCGSSLLPWMPWRHLPTNPFWILVLASLPQIEAPESIPESMSADGCATLKKLKPLWVVIGYLTVGTLMFTFVFPLAAPKGVNATGNALDGLYVKCWHAPPSLYLFPTCQRDYVGPSARVPSPSHSRIRVECVAVHAPDYAIRSPPSFRFAR